MAIKMKGIFKGLKIISQMFVHKEHEMEIGYPTDVKHVAHIGLGTSDTSPSWMNEFTGTEDLSTGSLSTTTAPSRQTSWASLDFEQPRSMLPIEILPEKSGQEAPSCPDIPRGPRKEEDQDIITYLVCKIIVLEVKNLVRNRIRCIQRVAKRVSDSFNDWMAWQSADVRLQ
uniref:CRIB domain-containing protein n=1 Tax=Oryza meridionalis TaxID=40149 RepID=A0A0E0CG09_9ORYZ